MLKRDRAADDNDNKYHLQISLTGYASDLIKEVVDSVEYKQMTLKLLGINYLIY